MTKLVAISIYGKKLKKSLLQNHKAHCLKFWYVVLGEGGGALVVKSLKNDRPGLTLTCFMAR